MMRHRPGDAALGSANRHHASRVRRRKLRQLFREITPRIDVKGVLIEAHGPRQDATNQQPLTHDRRAWK